MDPITEKTSIFYVETEDSGGNLSRTIFKVIHIALTSVASLAACFLLASSIPSNIYLLFLPFIFAISLTLTSEIFNLTGRVTGVYKPVGQTVEDIDYISGFQKSKELSSDPSLPLGIYNPHQNCFLNSLIQFFEMDCDLSARLQDLVPDSDNVDDFCRLLQEYDLHDLSYEFRNYHEEHSRNYPGLHPKLTFCCFLGLLTPNLSFKDLLTEPIIEQLKNGANFGDLLSPSQRKEINWALKEKFRSLLILDKSFKEFYSDFEESNHTRLAASLQGVRLALIKICPHHFQGIKEICQADVMDMLREILYVLPNTYKMDLQESFHLELNGHKVQDSPVLRAPEVAITLQFKNEVGNSLNEMLQDYLLEKCYNEFAEREGKSYPLIHKERFINPKTTLRFELRRQNQIQDGDRILEKKILDKVDVPFTIQIPLQNKKYQEYSLRSYIVHQGITLKGGHYVSYIAKERKFYRLSDLNVSEIDQNAFLEEAKNAYVLSYKKDDLKI